MPGPSTRAELVAAITTSYDKLRREFDLVGAEIADQLCDGSWTVGNLLEVRIWWTRAVVDWIAAGQRGEMPVTPARGYRWTETPRLNRDIIARASPRSWRTQRAALDRGVARVLAKIEALDDRELFAVGVFAWAGKWPLARWLAINTARQYATARTLVRRAVRSAGDP